jgi:hypothetical protein
MTLCAPTKSLVSLLALLCVLPPAAMPQSRVELTPYAGVYVPMGALTPSAALKRETSLSAGGRLTIWLPGRVSIEGTLSYAPSNVTPNASTAFTFPGPSSGHLTTVAAKAILRLSAPDALAQFYVGGGLGHVFLGGDTYSIDGYGEGTSTGVGGVASLGTAFKLGPSFALRLDAEDYIFQASFQCRFTHGTRGVCWGVNQGGSPSASELQNDVVLSVGLAFRVGGQ